MAKPKPTKQKIAKDFEKKVVKVGKMKKGPANKTDTSFTSKKVIIRSQNFSTSSNQGCDEEAVIGRIRACLVNCGHYNGNMRKDSTLNILKCLKELPDLHSATFLSALDSIFVATFRQICDEELGVRTAFLGLIGFLFENVKKENLASFFPRWLSFLNLASSHIKPEIRRDSVRFIGVTLKLQKGLFIPNIHTNLQNMIPLLTQYPVRSGSVPAFDCALALIDAYIEPFISQKRDDQLAEPLFSVTWPSSTPLWIVRPSPFSTTSTLGSQVSSVKPQIFTEAVLKTIISHLGNLSISLFLDTVHLLNKTSNLTNTTIKTSTEFKQIQEIISLYRKLYTLARVCGDEDLFWRAMPVKLVKNYKPILEDLIK